MKGEVVMLRGDGGVRAVDHLRRSPFPMRARPSQVRSLPSAGTGRNT